MSGIIEEVTIGDCRLILGDCREVLQLLPPVDLVLTDPPYGIGEAAGKNKSRGKIAVARDYGDDTWDNERRAKGPAACGRSRLSAGLERCQQRRK